MFGSAAVDDFYGVDTPECPHRIVSEEQLSGIPEITTNERYRIGLLLLENPSKDAWRIRRLYGMGKKVK